MGDRMKTIITIGAAALLCAGCASGAETTPTSPASPDGSATPSAAADGGCARATVDGTTEQAKLQRIATGIYGGLTCGTGTTLDQQLAAAAKSAEPRLRAAGIQSSLTSAGGGSSLSLTHDFGGCQIMVVDSVDSKSLTCMDL